MDANPSAAAFARVPPTATATATAKRNPQHYLPTQTPHEGEGLPAMPLVARL